MVDRRRFVAAFTVTFATIPYAAMAQQRSKVWRLGYLGTADPAATPYLAVFRDAMRERGHVEGKNLQIEYRW